MKADQRKTSMLAEFSATEIRSNPDLRRDFESTRTVTGASARDTDRGWHPSYFIPPMESYIKFR